MLSFKSLVLLAACTVSAHAAQATCAGDIAAAGLDVAVAAADIAKAAAVCGTTNARSAQTPNSLDVTTAAGLQLQAPLSPSRQGVDTLALHTPCWTRIMCNIQHARTRRWRRVKNGGARTPARTVRLQGWCTPTRPSEENFLVASLSIRHEYYYSYIIRIYIIFILESY